MTSPPPATSAMPAAVRAFLTDELRFAIASTLDPDGASHQAVVWYRLDGETVVVNSANGRRWPANLRRDPRISLAVVDGYAWVAVRGTVEIVDDQAIAQADIAEMARRYHADEPATAERLIHDQFERQHRVTFRIRAERFAVHLDE
jgi:PPOX class probable F420-dependent enzyme